MAKTIFHKNLHQVVYVFAETAGRPPADAVVDMTADRNVDGTLASHDVVHVGKGWVSTSEPRPVEARTFFTSGGGIERHVPRGFRVAFAGEGEWKITLDVFRDLGLAFGAALIAIYILLVGQTRWFVIPIVVMLAIPLSILGIMPGFWLLNAIGGGQVGGYADPKTWGAGIGSVTRNNLRRFDSLQIYRASGDLAHTSWARAGGRPG